MREKDDDLAKKYPSYILETEVIDTGSGVDPNTQKELFIPFLELKNRMGIIASKHHHSIGLGLASSSTIILALDGDIKLKESKKDLTVFSFKIPIYVR
mmetsp:Transcript_31774/g.48767  ORF Transcript_31774/g.48767 Transcript_31774/m.48767 type:complete len:98 (-) Transcript_31774:3046-3339(-)